MRPLILLILTAVVAHAALAPEKTESVRRLAARTPRPAGRSRRRRARRGESTEPEAYLLLGSVNIAKGDADAAISAYEKATALAPENGDYQRQLGDAYGFAAQKAGMFSVMGLAKKCRIAYEKAVELEPANLNARNSLMTYFQQAPSIAGGGMDRAYAQAAEIKKLDDVRGRVAYATLYAAEKKFAEAFAEFDGVLKDAPDNYPALYQLGRLAALSGQHLDAGIEALNKCLRITPPAGAPGHDAANWRLGNLWEKKGDKPAARAAYQAALAVNPNFQQAIDSLKKLK